MTPSHRDGGEHRLARVPVKKRLGGRDVPELQRLRSIDEHETAAEEEGARLVNDDTSHARHRTNELASSHLPGVGLRVSYSGSTSGKAPQRLTAVEGDHVGVGLWVDGLPERLAA